jgi:hypothetical protein
MGKLPRIVPGDGARFGVCARIRLLAFALSFLIAGAARADMVVPSGATTNLGTGILDLACTDLVVAGTFQVAGGAVHNVRNITVQSGGMLDGGSGVIQVGGNWSNSGSFVAATGEVDFRDICGSGPSTISGSTTFNRASFVSTTGKNYVFAVGTTQTILSLLEISGTAAKPIQFRSSVPGQVAFINLVSAGTQQIQHVGVTDVWATGQWLAPGLTNEGGGGNAHRWFGQGPIPGGGAVQIPMLEDSLLFALATLLAASGAWFARRRLASHRRETFRSRADEARDED